MATNEKKRLNEDELFALVSEKLVNMEGWSYDHKDDQTTYTLKVDDLTIRVSSYYGYRTKENATLAVFDCDGKKIYDAGEHLAQDKIIDVYYRLEKRRNEVQLDEEKAKISQSLEKLLAALEKTERR